MYAILVPPGAVLLFVAIMAFESDYTHLTRVAFFGTGGATAQTAALKAKTSGSEIGTTVSPPAQIEKEVDKHALGIAKTEVESKENKLTHPDSAAVPGEAKQTASASGSPAGVAPGQSDIAAAAKAPELKFYTLKPGDTLWKIAEAVYGHGHGVKYHLIFDANKLLLSKPGKIFPGQVLRIPPLSG
jgi:nucleoid-associated protein YgaU